MQSHLLTSALRRRLEFRISTCPIDVDLILAAVALTPLRVVILSLNHSVDLADQMATMLRIHLTHPSVVKVSLTESHNRELVVSAFRSGAGEFSASQTLTSVCFAGAFSGSRKVRSGLIRNR
jgi:hypothetical protein